MSLIEKILQKKETHEYFIALGVEEHRIIAAVAEVWENHVTILGHGESEFREGENEIEASDIAISTAEKDLPENIFVRKVIFGLPIIFLDGDKVKPEYMKRLQKITKELDLQPGGFVEYPQALSNYIEKKEEASPTLLLLGIGRNHLILSLLRVGKVEKNIVTVRTESLNTDFEKILGSFESEILPSRLIIYDEVKGTQMEAIKEELLQFAWHKFASFLHTPKIEILEDFAIHTALVEAAAGSLIKQFYPIEMKDELITQPSPSEQEIKKSIVEENETFGFKKTHHQTEKLEGPNELPTKIIDNNVKISDDKNLDNLSIPTKLPFTLKVPSIPFSLSSFSFNFLPALLLIILIFSSISLSFLFLYLYPKSSVNLIVYPLFTSQQLNISLTTKADKASAEKKILLVSTKSEGVEGSKSIVTTGTSKIGDPAKGEVIIYNKTVSGKIFPKGTILTNGSLKFSLDTETNIASSSDTGEGLTFGKSSSKVTSLEIGPESNLISGSIFGFKDFPQSSYYAKNAASFTGGISRDVTSVSKNDQNKLLTSLVQELETSAKQKIIQKQSLDEKIIDDLINSEIISQKFSKDVGTEAKELNLSLSLIVNVYIYKSDDLNNFAKSDLFSAPSGYKIDNNKIQAKISQVKKEKNGDLTGVATFTASFIPDIDTLSLLTKINGKTYKEVNSIVSSVENIGGMEINIEKDPFILKDRLPWNKSNIKINIVPR